MTPSAPGQLVCAFLVFFAIDLPNHVSRWLTADRVQPLERLLIEIYGAVLEHIFSSPAQHQIHHCRHPDQLDKNLARHFARPFQPN